MKLPLVTCVCLTTHPRRASMLPDALRAYRQQTYSPRELLVVNDGEPLRSRVRDVRVVNLPPRGHKWTIGEKRNVGVRFARGDYLATWDDDDVCFPHRLACQVRDAMLWNASIVLADAMYVADERMNLVGNCGRGKVHAVMASALIARNAVVAAGGYQPADYKEDAEMLERVRYLTRGNVSRASGCDWYVMRRHGGNVTLDAGETTEEWLACGARSPEQRAAAETLARVLAGPGGTDVIG